MLQSVLSPIPSYSMTYFKLPISLVKRIQSVITRFLWDNTDGVQKMAWVSWDSLAKPKAIGGLGMKDFEIFNGALLAKTGWRLINRPECLLAKVLKGKYYADTDFLLVTEVSAISHGWKSILIGRTLLKNNIGWIVGTGEEINIWSDPWLSLIKQQRPMGPPTEATANLWVSDLFLNDSTQWDRSRLQAILPEYEEQILSIKPSLSGAPDKLIWLGTK